MGLLSAYGRQYNVSIMGDLNTKIRAIYQPPNNEVLLQTRFFSSRQAHNPRKTMCRRCARCRRLLVCVGPIPEHIKVSTFLNGLRHGPALQDLFRKVPSTM